MQGPPHRPRPPLRVRVSFEPTRLAADHLVAAYDQVLPAVQRHPCEPNAPSHSEQAPAAKEQA